MERRKYTYRPDIPPTGFVSLKEQLQLALIERLEAIEETLQDGQAQMAQILDKRLTQIAANVTRGRGT